MSGKNAERVQAILVLAFAVIVIGTALIPAILAYVFGWQMLMIYPALLVFIVVLSLVLRRK